MAQVGDRFCHGGRSAGSPFGLGYHRRMIKSPRISLQPVEQVSSASAYDAVMSSRHGLAPWMHWLTSAYSLRDQQAFQARCAVLRGAGLEFNYGIVTPGGQVLGVCGLHRIDVLHATAEAGYWVRMDHWRRGVARRALTQLLDKAFREHALSRVELIIDCDNTASIGLAEAIGAGREARLQQRLFRDDARHDAWLYAVTRSRWSASRTR